MRWTMRLAAGLAAALVAGAALAQGFPQRSLEELAAADAALARQQTKTAKPGDLMFTPADNGARAAAVYTGQSRPLESRRQIFIVAFASSSQGNDRYGALYKREYLFRSGSRDYWLPVQSQVADYFAKELKPGAPVMLYLRNAGGFRTELGWEWVFLVEEFEGPNGAPPPNGAPAKPGAPQGAGPKIEA